MTADDRRFIRYPEERAIEDAAVRHGLTPTRLVALLLPVLSVEVEATITEGEAFRIIDKFVERSVAEAGLVTAAEVASFLGLDPVLVYRALRFLVAIGHVTDQGGRLAVTDLGRASLRDGRRYRVTVGDRRKLYFDAFRSRPLTRPYYDSAVVTLWSQQEAAERSNADGWPRFSMLAAPWGLHPDALTHLTDHPERDRYNLPARVEHPRPVGRVETRYLPAYVVRAVTSSGERRYLAYSQVDEKADPDLTSMVEQTDEVVAVVESEDAAGRAGVDRERVERWLARKRFGVDTAEETPGGWQVTLPADAFTTGGLGLSKVGSYVMLSGTFLRVWCDDVAIREAALRARATSQLAARLMRACTRADADELIATLARQLDVGATDVDALHRMATSADDHTLAGHLARL